MSEVIRELGGLGDLSGNQPGMKIDGSAEDTVILLICSVVLVLGYLISSAF